LRSGEDRGKRTEDRRKGEIGKGKEVIEIYLDL
jgi:hypothetical protein